MSIIFFFCPIICTIWFLYKVNWINTCHRGVLEWRIYSNYIGFIKIEFNSTVSITGRDIVFGTTIMSVVGSFVEIDGLRRTKYTISLLKISICSAIN
jgi:hypothetical protein